MKCEMALKGFSYVGFGQCLAMPDGNVITFIKITSIINALIQCRQRDVRQPFHHVSAFLVLLLPLCCCTNRTYSTLLLLLLLLLLPLLG